MLKILKSIAGSLFPRSYVKRDVRKFKDGAFKSYYNALFDTLHTMSEDWVVNDCDAMLWQGLYAASSRDYAYLNRAEDKIQRGKFYRTPRHDCYALGKSASTWSKDMSIGLFYACLRNPLLKCALKRHYDYGKKNFWFMGEPKKLIGRVYYTPFHISLLCKVLGKLWNKKYLISKIPQVFTHGLDDYEAHLQCLTISMIGEIDNKIPKEAAKRIKEHYNRCPGEPLYAVLNFIYCGGSLRSVENAIFNPSYDSFVRNDLQKKKINLLFSIDLLLRSSV